MTTPAPQNLNIGRQQEEGALLAQLYFLRDKIMIAKIIAEEWDITTFGVKLERFRRK